tara:strand:+ start:168 stop:917 length:750 start_codon:yes stop_codon:yes gene_type:complete
MLSNDPFKTHGLDHISASQINTFIHSPFLWACRVANIDNPVGASAFRGSAVEAAAIAIGQNKLGKHSALAHAEHKYFRELGKAGITLDDPKAKKELDLVRRIVEMLSNSFDDTVIESQKEISIQLDDIPVPITGYADMICTDKIIELKTKAATQTKLEYSANLQASIYQEALGLDAYIYYVYPKGYTTFKANHEDGIRRIKQTARAMHNILSLSNDIEEIIRSYLRPNPDDFRVNDVHVEFFNSIIGVK